MDNHRDIMELLGIATIVLALINVVLYGRLARMICKTTHTVTQILRTKFLVELCLMLTVVGMGMGAYLDQKGEYWAYLYSFRIFLLILNPIVLTLLVASFLREINK